MVDCLDPFQFYNHWYLFPDKSCCLVKGHYECCITTTKELQVPLQENNISTNNNTSIGASVQNSGSCKTNSDCTRFQRCCPAGVCCTIAGHCCGDHCCPTSSRCCTNNNVCCSHNMACCDNQSGCCAFGSACCKGICCPFLAKCCTSGCAPVGYTCCGDSLCAMASKCCSSDQGSWCCSQNKNCGQTYQTCDAADMAFSPVLMLLTLMIVMKLKGVLSLFLLLSAGDTSSRQYYGI